MRIVLALYAILVLSVCQFIPGSWVGQLAPWVKPGIYGLMVVAVLSVVFEKERVNN